MLTMIRVNFLRQPNLIGKSQRNNSKLPVGLPFHSVLFKSCLNQVNIEEEENQVKDQD